MSELAMEAQPVLPQPDFERFRIDTKRDIHSPEFKKKLQELESVFISTMFEKMMETNEEDSPFGGGFDGKMYASLFPKHVGDIIAKSGKLGIAKRIYEDLARQQQANKNLINYSI